MNSKCFINCDGHIISLDTLNSKNYRIVQKSNYTEIQILKFDRYGSYVADGYVLYNSLEELKQELAKYE